jgi:hypothetical protein
MPYESENLDRIFEEIQGANDRAAIIVGAALVEDALEQCIASRLRDPANKEERRYLFGEEGCFGTFALKICGAYFLRLIGPETKRDLDLVRRIRNKAAHEMTPISFEGTPAIASLCRELEFAKRSIPGQASPVDLRGKFLLTVQFFSSAMFLRAADSYPEIREAGAGVASYLDH